MYPDILETFDIETEHINPPCEIYNKLEKRFVPATPRLVALLLELKISERIAIRFHQEKLDPENLVTIDLYHGLLEVWANAKRALKPWANEFCIAHKGYSLN